MLLVLLWSASSSARLVVTIEGEGGSKLLLLAACVWEWCSAPRTIPGVIIPRPLVVRLDMSTPRVRRRTFFRSERPRFRVRRTGSAPLLAGEVILLLTLLLTAEEVAGAPPSSLPSASTQPDPPRVSPPLISPAS